MPTKDRFSQSHARGKMVPLFDVRRLDRYASHLSVHGHLFEYDQGRFWRTNLLEDEPVRRQVEDNPAIPIGPWYHHSLCDCEVCGRAARSEVIAS